MKELEKKFGVPLTEVQTINLGTMARQRGCVCDGRISLAKLSLEVLNEKMLKEDEVRSSKWSKIKSKGRD